MFAEKKAIILRKLAENMLPILGVRGKVLSSNKFTSGQVNQLIVDRVIEDKVTDEQSSFW